MRNTAKLETSLLLARKLAFEIFKLVLDILPFAIELEKTLQRTSDVGALRPLLPQEYETQR